MNANEVIANLALELLGLPKGDYATINPNDHVNRSQSTNDTYPTAFRLALHTRVGELRRARSPLYWTAVRSERFTSESTQYGTG